MATAITTKENIIVDRDYSDNFAIKETAIEKLSGKYFPEIDLSALPVHLISI